MSLRERKKARTRALIQSEALRLFREQGYSDTTMEQIAQAAEVALSTLFRYFPAKEDLVLVDEFPAFRAALREAPADLGPVAAVRHAMRALAAGRGAEEGRERLVITVPELWAASLRSVTGGLSTVQELLAERSGVPAAAMRDRTGAIVGVIFAVWLDWSRHPELDGPAELDRALAELEILDGR